MTDMTVDDFFEGMSRVAASVSVVTSNGPAGKVGITVSSMTSVTAEPPTLLICINSESPSCETIRQNGIFCVNVLQDDQASISNSFAGQLKEDEPDPLSTEHWNSSANGVPIFKNALVSFECEVAKSIQVGSHVIFFGKINHVNCNEGSPLIYVNRGYLPESK